MDMTPDQQFQIQFWTLIIGFATTALGMAFTFFKSNQAVIQSSAARNTAETAVAVSVANGHKSDEANHKLVEIHTLTNSNLSNVNKALEVANEKISGLEKMVAAMHEAKGVADRTAEGLAAKVLAPQPRPARATDLTTPILPVPVKIVPDKDAPLPVDVIERHEKDKLGDKS